MFHFQKASLTISIATVLFSQLALAGEISLKPGTATVLELEGPTRIRCESSDEANLPACVVEPKKNGAYFHLVTKKGWSKKTFGEYGTLQPALEDLQKLRDSGVCK